MSRRSDRPEVTPSRSRAPALCFGVPVLVLGGAYLWLALDHGTLRLWNVVVHESGRYTLGGTVLYYGHFLREVPTTAAFALFLLGSSGIAEPGAAAGGGVRRGVVSRRVGWVAVLLAAGLVGGALLRTATLHGWTSAWLDLAQYRTRDDVVGFGSHWRYHWLSTVWFGAAVGLAPTLTRRLGGSVRLAPHRAWMGLAWGYVLVLTLVFGLSGDVFLDVRHAGHQAREILTHGPVTLLLGIGAVLLTGGSRRRRGTGPPPLPRVVTGGFAALAVAVPLHLAVVTLTGDVMEQGQSEHGLAAMVAAHYFEHSLDYLLALLLLVACLALDDPWAASPSDRTPPLREQRTHGRH